MQVFRNFSFAAVFAILALLGLGNLPDTIRPAFAQGFNLSNLLPGLPTAPSVASTSDGTAGFYFGNGFAGVTKHFAGSSASVPVVTACGTTPTLAAGSGDFSGTITMGTTATGCVLTFGTPFTVAPSCNVTWRATPLASQSYTNSATALTLTQTSTSSNLVDYTCYAKSGG